MKCLICKPLCWVRSEQDEEQAVLFRACSFKSKQGSIIITGLGGIYCLWREFRSSAGIWGSREKEQKPHRLIWSVHQNKLGLWSQMNVYKNWFDVETDWKIALKHERKVQYTACGWGTYMLWMCRNESICLNWGNYIICIHLFIQIKLETIDH